MKKATLLFFFAIGFISIATMISAQSSVTLEPSLDNTLYESTGGTISNAQGIYLFSGRTDQTSNSLRRALLKFDVSASIPSGSTIESVSLQMNMNRTINIAANTHNLHRASKAWGEGTSDAPGQEGGGAVSTTGDATWVHNFFSSSTWTNLGGDFTAAASASTNVMGNGNYTWTSAALAADVQDMLDNPATNHGWILIGNETITAAAKRWGSAEIGLPANRPKLIINFCPPPDTLWADNFVSAGSGNSKASLNWNLVAPAVNYTVQGGLLSTPPASFAVVTVGGPFTAVGLAETSYRWQVRSNCAASSSAFTKLDTFAIPKCLAPINLTTTVAGSSATFSWDEVPAAIGYIFEAGLNPGTFVFQQILSPGSATSLTLPGIPVGNYKWRVQAGCNVSPLRLSPFAPTEFFTIVGHSEKASVEFESFDIAPNPARGFTQLKSSDDLENVRIVNILGKTIIEFGRRTKDQYLPLNDLSSGVYFIQATINGKVYTRKISIE